MRRAILSGIPSATIAFLVLTGCGGSAPPMAAPMPPPRAPAGDVLAVEGAPAQPGAPMAPPAPAQPGVAKAGAPAAPATGTGAQKAKGTGAEVQRALVIYTGALRMVEDADKIPATIDKVIDTAEAMGGSMTARRDDGVEVRVPSEKFRETLTKLEGVGRVVQRSVKAEDVSEEYHDLEVRLSNLRATQKRLQEFLAKSANVTEALTVERELERVAVDIDRIEGRLSFLKARTSFSTISVQFTPKPKDAPVAKSTGPQEPRRVDLPVEWLGSLGVDPLLNLKK